MPLATSSCHANVAIVLIPSSLPTALPVQASSAIAFGTWNYTVLFIYLGAMVAVGVWLTRKQKTSEEYFLAGRRMPWLVVSMSMFASLTSAISYMGIPSRAYEENISMIAGFMAGPIVAILLIVLFLPFYHRLRVTTSYEYIDKRFGQPARFSVSGLFILARLGWLGTVIFAPAKALEVATGIDLYLAILLMGALATSYTALGGLRAVLWTDVAQFLILVGGAVWVGVSLLQAVPDGFDGIWRIASESGRTGGFHWRINLFEMTAITAIVATFLTTTQDYGTDQVTVQRLLSVKSFRGMAKAVLLNSVFDIVIVAMLLFLGLGMFAYFTTYPERLGDGIEKDKLLPFYIMHALPQGVSGLIIAAIFAAAMSSMDSGIHSLSTVITNDFVRPLRPHGPTEDSDRFDLILARILVVGLGLVGTLVAFWVSSFTHLLEAASAVLGLFNGPILSLFLLGVLTRRGRFGGWLVGAICGILVTLMLQALDFSDGTVRLFSRGENPVKVHWYYYFPASFFTSLLVGYSISLLMGGDPAAKELTVWGRRDLATRDG